jgi:hypothetical protein
MKITRFSEKLVPVSQAMQRHTRLPVIKVAEPSCLPRYPGKQFEK